MFVVILLLWSGIVELLFNQNQLSHAYLYSFSSSKGPLGVAALILQFIVLAVN